MSDTGGGFRETKRTSTVPSITEAGEQYGRTDSAKTVLSQSNCLQQNCDHPDRKCILDVSGVTGTRD
jgi:hypothetical protein